MASGRAVSVVGQLHLATHGATRAAARAAVELLTAQR